MNDRKPTLYEILGVPPTASLPQIRDAYQALQDQIATGKSGLDPEAAAIKQNWIALAWSTLSDPVSRGTYDRKLAQQSQREAVASPPGAGSGGDPRRAGRAGLQCHYRFSLVAAENPVLHRGPPGRQLRDPVVFQLFREPAPA